MLKKVNKFFESEDISFNYGSQIIYNLFLRVFLTIQRKMK